MSTRGLLALALAWQLLGAVGTVHGQTKTVKTAADIDSAQKKMLAAATKAKTIGCGKTIPSHIYNPQRLKVFSNCIAVTATIVDATAPQSTHRADGVRKEGNGDTHGWLKLDPEWKGLLNKGNMTDEDGNLVFEIVCYSKVTQANAKNSCPTSYKNIVRRTFIAKGRKRSMQ